MCPPPLSSDESWSSPSMATPSSSKPPPEDERELENRSVTKFSADDARMNISEGIPTNKVLLIDGHGIAMPADPVESFRFIRAQTLASYRSIVSGNSNSRDQALIFGSVTVQTMDRRSDVGVDPPVDKGCPNTTGGYNTKAYNHLHAQPVTAADHSSTVIPSEGHLALQPPNTHPGPGSSDIWGIRKYWQDKNGFIGDFEDPLDAKRKTHMSTEWAKGRYMDGAISLRGVFAKTQVMETRCDNCAGTGSACRLLVDGGKDDPFVRRLRRCGRFVRICKRCSLRSAE